MPDEHATTHEAREPATEPAPARATVRYAVAVAIGLVGAVLIWVATPYNNFVLGSSFIADSYLPVAGLFCILLLVLCVNPVLRKFRARAALDRRQLAIASGIFLIACVLPGQGLLRMLPYSLARFPTTVRENAALADAYETMRLPHGLFPGPLGFGAETPAADNFLGELQDGEPIPWHAWRLPLLLWGLFLVSCWLMMIGLTLMALPQWRRNERLAFPLLRVYEALLAAPAPGTLVPPIFRSRAFWSTTGVVFLLHLLVGLNAYNPERMPAIPLSWDLSRLFAEGPLAHLPGYIRTNRVYFIFVGVAFFMPNRISFSVWVTVLAYAAYRVIGRCYFPPYYGGTVGDHRTGALIVLALAVLWIGRRHWGRLLAGAFRSARTPQAVAERRSTRMFLLGCAGMWAWLVAMGVGSGWALFLVGIAFIISLMITRIVAETGMPFVRIDFNYQIGLLKLFPVAWIGGAALFFSYVIAMLFPTASRVAVAPMAMQAIELDAERPPASKVRFGLLLVAVLLAGLVICGAANLHASYHHGMTLDGAEQPISPWGTRRFNGAHAAVLELGRGELSRPSYSQAGHLAFGAALAGGLQWACLAFPKWPLHPIGLLMVNTFYANEAWVSIFVGWLLKVLLIRYGGSRLYQRARPAFLGLIMGEAFAAVLWAVVPAVLAGLGMPYKSVQVLPH